MRLPIRAMSYNTRRAVTGSRLRRDFGQITASYCIDAPEIIPSGSTMSWSTDGMKAAYQGPERIFCREEFEE